MKTILFPDRNIWIAQCLEYDICAQGDTKQEALDSLEWLILGQIHLDKENGLSPLQEIPKPPFFLVDIPL